jgi:outer membrane protein
MRNINYVINGVLAVAISALFVLRFIDKTEKSVGSPAVPEVGAGTEGILPVAYVNMDSVLLNYNYSKDLNEVIMRKEENARANLNQQANQWQSEAQDYQRKLDNHAFLTRDRAQQEQQRLLKKQQDLQDYGDRIAKELDAERQQLTLQLNDSLISLVKAYNKDKNYKIIFSNIGGSNILIADDVYDITADVIAFLNKNYSPSSASK